MDVCPHAQPGCTTHGARDQLYPQGSCTHLLTYLACPSPAALCRAQLIAGGIPDGNWPPYATNVVLELWKPVGSDADDSHGAGAAEGGAGEGHEEEAVVRVLYNGVPTRVKGCGAVGGSGYTRADTDAPDPYQWCPFSQWQVRVLLRSLTALGDKNYGCPLVYKSKSGLRARWLDLGPLKYQGGRWVAWRSAQRC